MLKLKRRVAFICLLISAAFFMPTSAVQAAQEVENQAFYQYSDKKTFFQNLKDWFRGWKKPYRETKRAAEEEVGKAEKEAKGRKKTVN